MSAGCRLHGRQLRSAGQLRKRRTWPWRQTDIERLIKERFPDALVSIDDLAGDGDHYAATVVSEAFRGKSRVEQHKMVYDALGGQVGADLHALALKTQVPG